MLNKNQSNKRRIKILLPLPFAEGFDYAVPETFATPVLGAFVEVFFGPRKMVGVVWALESQAEIEDSKVKSLLKVLDKPPLSKELLQLIEWVSDYTLFPLGSVLKMVMSVPDAFFENKTQMGYVLSPETPKIRMTSERKRVLEALTDSPLSVSDLSNLAGVSSAVVRGLAETGILKPLPIAPVFFKTPDFKSSEVELSEQQSQVANDLSALVSKGFSVNVLNGVTGSGKTEVYFDVIARTLEEGKQCVILLPEIGLTGQWLERFERRFKTVPALWHSGLTPTVRRQTWNSVLNGEVKVLAGTRSALFLPFLKLGSVIVDEEHDASFKQEEGVVYHARDMAVVRAKIENIPIILSSATPSLETKINVQAGRYQEFILPKRFGKAVLPDISLIDMRTNAPLKEENNKSFIAPLLLSKIEERLERKEQSLLFLNRRGYAPLVLCQKCGHRFSCPNCSSWLVEHRSSNRLECHHCGYSLHLPDKCPVCGEEDCFVSCGPGVERISEEVTRNFPNAKQLVMTSDLNASASKIKELMRQIYEKEVDIVIGTQMLTKGHHFPHLTLVGVIDADLGLSGGDLRAGERTFQMLNQVAGRAGRMDKKGEVFLQTFEPENQIMQALSSGDSEAFFQAEISSRELLKMPPFGRLAGVIISSKYEDAAFKTAELLGRFAPHTPDIRVLGPTPAPLSLLRGKYRFRLLLQTTRRVKIQEVIKQWLAQKEIPHSVRIQVDIDPYSFF